MSGHLQTYEGSNPARFDWTDLWPRYRLVEPFAEGRRVLEVGTRDPRALSELVDAGAQRVVATSPSAGAETAQGVELVPMPSGALSFDDNAFDVLLVADLAVEIKANREFLEEARRVVAEDGLLLFGFAGEGRGLGSLFEASTEPLVEPERLMRMVHERFPSVVFYHQSPFVGVALRPLGVHDEVPFGAAPYPGSASYVVAAVGQERVLDRPRLLELPFTEIERSSARVRQGQRATVGRLMDALRGARRTIEEQEASLREIHNRLPRLRAVVEQRAAAGLGAPRTPARLVAGPAVVQTNDFQTPDEEGAVVATAHERAEDYGLRADAEKIRNLERELRERSLRLDEQAVRHGQTIEGLRAQVRNLEAALNDREQRTAERGRELEAHLTAKQRELELELAEKSTKIQVADLVRSQLEASLRGAQGRAASAEGRVRALEEARVSQEEALESLGSRIRDLEEQLSLASEREQLLSDAEVRARDLEEEAAERERYFDEAEERIRELEKQLSSADADRERTSDETRFRIGALEGQLAEAAERELSLVSAADGRSRTLEGQLAEAAEQSLRAEARVRDLEEALSESTRQVASFSVTTDRVQELENELSLSTARNEALSGAEARIAELEEALSLSKSHDGALLRAEERIRELEAQLSQGVDREEALSSAEYDLAEARRGREDLQQRVEQLEHQLRSRAQVHGQHEASRVEIEALSARLDEALADLQAVSEREKGWRRTSELLETEIASLSQSAATASKLADALDDAERNGAELKERNDFLETAAQQSQRRLDALEDELRELRSELERSRAEALRVGHALGAQHENMAARAVELGSATRALADREEKIQGLQARSLELGAERRALELTAQHLATELEKHQDRCSILREERDALAMTSQLLLKERDEANAHVQGLELQLTEQHQALLASESTAVRAEQAVAGRLAELEAAQRREMALQDRLASKERQRVDLERRVHVLEGELAAAQREVQALDGRLGESTEQVVLLTTRLQSAERQAETEIFNHVEALRVASEAHRDRQQLQGRLAQLESSAAEADAMVARSLAEKASAEGAVSEAVSARVEAEARNALVRAELAETLGKKASLENLLVQVIESHDALESELTELAEERDRLDSGLLSAKAEASALRASLAEEQTLRETRSLEVSEARLEVSGYRAALEQERSSRGAVVRRPSPDPVSLTELEDASAVEAARRWAREARIAELERALRTANHRLEESDRAFAHAERETSLRMSGEARIAELERALADANEAMGQRNQALSEVECELVELRPKVGLLDRLTNELMATRDQRKSLEDELTSARREVEAARHLAAQSQVKGDSRRSELGPQFEVVEASLRTEKAKTEELAAELTRRRSQQASVVQELEAYKLALAGLEERLLEVESQALVSGRDAEEARAVMASQENGIKKLEILAAQHEGRAAGAEEELKIETARREEAEDALMSSDAALARAEVDRQRAEEHAVQLGAQLGRLQREVETRQVWTEQAQERVAALEGALVVARSQASAAADPKDLTTEEELERLEAAFAEAEDTAERIESLESALAEAEARAAHLDAAREEAETRAEEAESLAREAEVRLEEAQTESAVPPAAGPPRVDPKLRNTDARLRALKVSLEDAEARAQQARRAVSRAEEQTDSNRLEVRRLQEQLQLAERAVDDRQGQIRELSRRIPELEAALQHAERRAHELESELKKAEARLKTAEGGSRMPSGDASETRRLLDEAKVELERTAEAARWSESERARLQASLDLAEARVIDLESELAAPEERRSLQADLESRRVEIGRLEKEVEALTTECLRLRRQLESAES